MMKNKFAIFCAGFFLLVNVYCSSFGFHDRKEGPADNVFRVYVRIDTLDIPETMTDKELDNILLQECGERFKRIWNAMCRAQTLADDKNLTIMVDSIVKSGKLSYRKEREEYAEAFTDYTLDKDTSAKLKKTN